MRNRLWVLAVNDSSTFEFNDDKVIGNHVSDKTLVFGQEPWLSKSYLEDKGKGLFLKETEQVTIHGEEFEVGWWINRREDQEKNVNYCYILLSVGVYSKKSKILQGFIF